MRKSGLAAKELGGLDVAEAFVKAWEGVVDDYKKKRLNSERCLQASLYFHLRKRLNQWGGEIAIYVEPPIRLAMDGSSEEKKFIDLIVVRKGEKYEILFAAELKYTPRGAPSPDAIAADLEKLSFVKNHKERRNRVYLRNERFLMTKESAEEQFSVAAGCIVAFAVIANREKFRIDREASNPTSDFWREYGGKFQAGSVWNELKSFPKKRLLVCSAITSRTDGAAKVEPLCFGAGA